MRNEQITSSVQQRTALVTLQFAALQAGADQSDALPADSGITIGAIVRITSERHGGQSYPLKKFVEVIQGIQHFSKEFIITERLDENFFQLCG